MAAGIITLTMLDGAGNSRNAQFWSSDGTTAGNLYPVSVAVDSSGNVIDYTTPAGVQGGVASGASQTDKPVNIGGRAATANPTAVADGQNANRMLDKVGRIVTAPFHVRDMIGSATVTVTASTTATTLIAALGAGLIADIVSITLTNTSATDSEVQLLDADGTTVRWVGWAKANDMRGIVLPVALKGAAANAVWNIKTVTSISSLKATVQYVINT